MCLRFKLCNHQWPGRTKMLKSLYAVYMHAQHTFAAFSSQSKFNCTVQVKRVETDMQYYYNCSSYSLHSTNLNFVSSESYFLNTKCLRCQVYVLLFIAYWANYHLKNITSSWGNYTFNKRFYWTSPQWFLLFS